MKILNSKKKCCFFIQRQSVKWNSTDFDFQNDFINTHKTLASLYQKIKCVICSQHSICQFSLKSSYAIFGALYKHLCFAVLCQGLKCLLLSITFRLIGLNKKEGKGAKTVCHFLFLTHHWSDGSLCPDCDGKVLQLFLPNAEQKSEAPGMTLKHLRLCMQNRDRHSEG